MNLQLSLFLAVLNQIRVDHWQTKSFASHMALGTAYDELDDIFDDFIEKFYGREDVSTEQVLYSVEIESYRGDSVTRYINLKNTLLEYLCTITMDKPDLKNIQDEIEGILNHLIYRLRQS